MLNHKNNLYIFIHVPKCAGVTFRELMKNNFSCDSIIKCHSVIPQRDFNTAKIHDVLEVHPYASMLHGHSFSVKIPEFCNGRRVIGISFVRNPVERFISHYYYMRNSPTVFDSRVMKMSLMEYAYEVFEKKSSITPKNVHNSYSHSQLEFLTDDSGNNGLNLISETLKKGNFYLFPVERFDEACLILEKEFEFKDCSYTKKHKTAKKGKIKENDFNILNNYFHIKSDFKLCNIANFFLENKIISNYPLLEDFDNNLKLFKERCYNNKLQLTLPKL